MYIFNYELFIIMDLKKTVKFKPTKDMKIKLPSHPPNQLQMWYESTTMELNQAVKETSDEKERETLINQMYILGLR